MLYRMILTWVISLTWSTMQAQLQENFQDGDFTSSPTWSGNNTDWIVNSSGQLQSANTTVNSTFFISTANHFSQEAEWNFTIRLAFNPSGVNYVDVFLTASSDNLLSTTLTGYFVRIGNTQDEIALYRKDAGGIVKLIDGTDGILNTSDNLLHIRVFRQSAFMFVLQRDSGNSGNYFTEGFTVDSTYRTSQFFGMLVRQSTNAFFQKHFFDDISIASFQPDVTPPAIESLTAVSSRFLDINFSEPVNQSESSDPAHYLVNAGIGHPSHAQRDPLNAAQVHLEFSGSFLNGVLHTLNVSGISDDWGNTIVSDSATFIYYEASVFDIVIDEIMADPSPPSGLPDAEYIELKNACAHPINLNRWKVVINGSAVTLTDYILKPDSFLILTAASNAPLFYPFGKVKGLPGFPTLDNDGSSIELISKEGIRIHWVYYSSSWYGNPVKKEGGWSLEMLDTRHPCAGGADWKVSSDASGGTPGRKNSVDGTFTDVQPPKLVRTFCPDSVTLVAYFDEVMDSASASDPSHYILNPFSGNITSASVFSEQLTLHLSQPLQKRQVYVLSVSGIKDCTGNELGSFHTAKVAIAEAADRYDVVINEILFHPRTGGYDYVECYNRSTKTLDAGKLLISKRNASGSLTPRKICNTPLAFYPGDYIVLTEDPFSLQREYLVKKPDMVVPVTSLPSFPNDQGDVVMLNEQGDVIDEVWYQEKWHFPLITNPEGIALERISASDTSSEKNNWHSASASSGFGTPTYKNSQSTDQNVLSESFEISPKLFSPDNDGRDDYVLIRYQMDEPGYVANIRIFDASGNQVRYFIRNALMGRSGMWTWDGLGEHHLQMSSGYYVLLIEVFNLKGKKKEWKFPVALAK